MASPRSLRRKEPLDEDALYEYALQALGRRMRTVAELRRLMRGRIEPGEAGEAKMQAVIARLKEYRYLDDTAYAADYARLRQENARLGKRRVRQDLQGKGVNPDIIAAALDAAYENVDEEALARQHLERKGIRPPANDKETARVMRMLVRAGFSTGAIYRVLRRWDASEKALAALNEDQPVEPEEI